MTPRLKSSLSAPLILEGELTGVLSVYSVDADVFTDEHKRIIEAISPQLAASLRALSTTEQTPAIDIRDAASGQPNLTKLELVYEASGSRRAESDRLSIVYITARIPADTQAGLPSSPDSQSLSTTIRRALRSADLLFQLGQREFVALLSNTDSFTAEMVAARIRSAANNDTNLVAQGLRLAIGVSTTASSAVSVEDAIDAARVRQQTVALPTAIH
jgi:GAF domain-containing protein